ncbi:hypothetical protein C8034_v011779 [Colletotrichum sidae]|uniref:Uncharacterized protein n=1 Tax=Colletotrichum sidae TaxID=1347389 RepID=A0A4R8THC9_9PEZI|nr:hypothetical protein C8034_v011779 [Colletotrichum sidae]
MPTVNKRKRVSKGDRREALTEHQVALIEKCLKQTGFSFGKDNVLKDNDHDILFLLQLDPRRSAANLTISGAALRLSSFIDAMVQCAHDGHFQGGDVLSEKFWEEVVKILKDDATFASGKSKHFSKLFHLVQRYTEAYTQFREKNPRLLEQLVKVDISKTEEGRNLRHLHAAMSTNDAEATEDDTAAKPSAPRARNEDVVLAEEYVDALPLNKVDTASAKRHFRAGLRVAQDRVERELAESRDKMNESFARGSHIFRQETHTSYNRARRLADADWKKQVAQERERAKKDREDAFHLNLNTMNANRNITQENRKLKTQREEMVAENSRLKQLLQEVEKRWSFSRQRIAQLEARLSMRGHVDSGLPSPVSDCCDGIVSSPIYISD